MKKLIIAPLLFMLCFNAFSQVTTNSQDLVFEVSGKHNNSIKKEKLIAAKSITDIIPNYPSTWINDYISIEVMVISNGTRIQAYSTNPMLNVEQVNLLNKADISSDIVINIAYTTPNAVSSETEKSVMHYTTTLVPDTEAEYTSGYEQMTKYIRENAINKIDAANPKFVSAIVKFTVNEQGEIADVQISRTSGHENTDKLLVETITKMPKWKPAQNSKGEKVKQRFEFSLNSPNIGGC